VSHHHHHRASLHHLLFNSLSQSLLSSLSNFLSPVVLSLCFVWTFLCTLLEFDLSLPLHWLIFVLFIVDAKLKVVFSKIVDRCERLESN